MAIDIKEIYGYYDSVKTPQIQVGARFGRLTVLSNFLPAGTNKRRLLCRCDCGTEKEYEAHNVNIGHTLSCGCVQKERTSKANTTHSGTGTRLYSIHNKMIQRCDNPNNPAYPTYGAKGIKVCPEWREFANFQKWALANGYTADREIDRLDNAIGYSPENCRWATEKEQQRNRSVVTYYTCWGESKLMLEWIEDPRCVVTMAALVHRLKKADWPVEAALTFPMYRKKPKVWPPVSDPFKLLLYSRKPKS